MMKYPKGMNLIFISRLKPGAIEISLFYSLLVSPFQSYNS